MIDRAGPEGMIDRREAAGGIDRPGPDGSPPEPPAGKPPEEGPSSGRRSVLREYGEALIVAVILVVIVRSFLIQAFRIPSSSMEDTLLVGDFLFVNKALYGAQIPFTESRLPGFRDPRRGDVVVFQFPKDPDRDFIKRVIGTPGDTLEIRGTEVRINGEPIVEPYTKFTAPRRLDPPDGGATFPRPGSPRDHYGPVVVPPDQYFVMGDNRDQSDDSRFWGFLPGKLVRGKAVFIYFSFDVKKKFPRFSRFGRPIR